MIIIRGILAVEAPECSALVAAVAVFGRGVLQAYFQVSILTSHFPQKKKSHFSRCGNNNIKRRGLGRYVRMKKQCTEVSFSYIDP